MAKYFRRLWLVLTCNWFVIGLACHTRGHQWRDMHVDGLVLTDCGWCGKFKGYRRR